MTVSQGDNFWYDVGLSDVEAIYASQNALDITFSTTSLKTSPISLFKIEVFVAPITSFGLADKLAKHLKELFK